jgi:hypothetical protein
MEENKQQQGTGSAENTGRNREEQVNQSMGGQQDISSAPGLSKQNTTTIEELGQRSGRDDYAGGFGDGMDDQDTGQGTDR